MAKKKQEEKYILKGKIPPEVTINEIVCNYEQLENSLVNQLELRIPNHQLTAGTYRETIWRSVFEQVIPGKFCIEQGVFIIDSYGMISSEIDLAIYDEQFTPYIFNYGKIKFIPIEAVSVVVQCKSGKLKSQKTNLNNWSKSVKKLKTAYNSIARMNVGLIRNNLDSDFIKYETDLATSNKTQSKSQTSTRPLQILCATSDEIDSIRVNDFDIILYLENNCLKKKIPQENWSYHEWFVSLNHYDHSRYGKNQANKFNKIMTPPNTSSQKTVSKEDTIASLSIIDKANNNENILLSLTFQLNQLLMLINNPMLFPHAAYVTMFNDNFEKYRLVVEKQKIEARKK